MTVEALELKSYEHSLMKKYWTRHLNEKEQKSGNTYMVRDRIRWILFQIALVGLQMNSAFQICLITMIQVIYLVIISREIKQKAIFSNYGTLIQYLFSEYAILVFLIVLSIFSLLQNTSFYDSKTYDAMQRVVLVAVFVAIVAQVISVIWGIVFSIKNFYRREKEKERRGETQKDRKIPDGGLEGYARV